MCPQRSRPSRMAPVAALVKTLQPVAQVLEALHLDGTQDTPLQGAQAQRTDAFGAVTDGEQAGRLGLHPGHERRERGQVVVMVAGARPCSRSADCQATTSRRTQADRRSWPYRCAPSA